MLKGQQTLSCNLAATEKLEDLRDVNLNNVLVYYHQATGCKVIEIHPVSQGTCFLEQKMSPACGHC